MTGPISSNGSTHSDHNDASTRRRIAAILAHPDDETFIIGGTLALYASLGHDIHVIYGPFGPEPDGKPSAQRIRELDAAASVLGITDYTFLPALPPKNARTGGSPSRHHPPSRHPSSRHSASRHPASRHSPPRHPASRHSRESGNPESLPHLTDAISEALYRLRPHVAITFDATGATGHLNHILMGAATLQAVGGMRQIVAPRLYAAVFGRRLLAAGLRFGQLARHKGLDDLRNALRIAQESQRPTTSIDVRSVLSQRREAARCYTTALAEGASWQRRWELLSPGLRRLFAPREDLLPPHPTSQRQ